MKIGILTTGNNSLLVETIKKRGHTPITLNPKYCYAYLSETSRGIDRLYYGGGSSDQPTRILPGHLDAIIPRVGCNLDYTAALLRFMVENLGIYSPCNAWGLIFAGNKSWCLQRLSSAGIPIPKTIITESPRHVKWAVDKLGSLPIILKTNAGSQGKTVAILDSKRSANSVMEFALNSSLKILLEEFIPGGASDYRVWVVGGEVVAAMKRTSTDPEDFRANISRSGRGELVTLSKSDQDLCIRAAGALGLGIAGVDLMKNEKTGKSFIIEINGNPGTKIIQITGVNVWESVVSMLEKNYKTADRTSLTSALVEPVLFNESKLLESWTEMKIENATLKRRVNAS